MDVYVPAPAWEKRLEDRELQRIQTNELQPPSRAYIAGYVIINVDWVLFAISWGA